MSNTNKSNEKYVYQQNSNVGNAIMNKTFGQNPKITNYQKNSKDLLAGAMVKTGITSDKKEEISTVVIMDAPKDIAIMKNRYEPATHLQITAEDMKVLSNVCTCIERELQRKGISFEDYAMGKCDKIWISPQDIVSASRKDLNPHRNYESQIGELVQILNKLHNIRIGMDCTEEFKERIKRDPEHHKIFDDAMQFTRYSPFLSMNLIEVTSETPVRYKDENGEWITSYKKYVYEVAEIPPLYRYAKQTGQILSIPIEWYAEPKYITSDFENVQMYILKRISIRKNKNNGITSNRILFSSLYEFLGEERSHYYYLDDEGTPEEIENMVSQRWNRRKRTLRDYVTNILGHLIDEKVIKGYSEVKERKEVVSVDIKY